MSSNTLLNLYTIGYYVSLMSTVIGCIAIFMRTKCTPSELLGKRYNHYFQEEISSFISYSCVLFVFLLSLGVEFLIFNFSENIARTLYEVLVYSVKIILEFSLVLCICWLHYRSLISHSKLTKVICVASIFIAFWHLLRLLDNVVFGTGLLDNCYSLVVTVVTFSVSVAMAVYALVYIRPREMIV